SDGSSTAGNEWANYDNAKWANAVTLKNTKDSSTNTYDANGTKHTDGTGTYSPLEYYRDIATIGTAIPEADILGYWVYVPRYAYEVQRLNPWNKPVCGNGLAGASYQDADCDANGYQAMFDIKFEKADTPKKTPYQGLVAVCNTAPTTSVGANNYTGGMDYRNDCGVSRTYGSQTGTTWATHPAFSLDKNSDGDFEDANEELNGIWIGKFTTSTTTYCHNVNATDPVSCGNLIAPADIHIKPNESPMLRKYIGTQFTISKNMSPNANNITGGNEVTVNDAINTMNLTENATTYMLKTGDWGAAAYLSTSKYGTIGQGNKMVYNNGYYDVSVASSSNTNYRYITGCGPFEDKADTFGATCNSYDTTIGQQASTTGNIYGIYDMAGPVWNYTMGNYDNIGSAPNMAVMPAAGYMNSYLESDGFSRDVAPAWSAGTSRQWWGYDYCTFEICGGHALYETTIVQSIDGLSRESWDLENTYFAHSSAAWFGRGATSEAGPASGIFAMGSNTGWAGVFSFRVSMAVEGE
ncbi:MAG: hypothetical protein LBM09_00225, partial [Candidatus Nomurabacteria bacterium]|nr:hypothetical protein [Candidatus Nomurabacteria bacterium]